MTTSGRIVPLIPRARHFINGLSARFPALRILIERTKSGDAASRVMSEHALELVLRATSVFPTIHPDDPSAARLVSADARTLVRLMKVHRKEAWSEPYRRLARIWPSIGHRPTRLIAMQHAIILGELLRLSYQARPCGDAAS